MAERDSNDPSIRFETVGGMDESYSPTAVPEPDFSLVHAMWPKQKGLLQRLPGTEFLAKANAGIWSIHQANDGTDNLIFQTNDGREIIYTVNELFGRAVTNTLIYEPQPDDEDMPTAIIIQDANNGTDLADIGGASANTFYTRPLTSNPVNESGIIITFTSGASASFEIAAGTYRIRGYVCASLSVKTNNGANPNTAEGGFQAAITDTTTSTTVATGTPASVKFERPTVANPNGYLGPTPVVSYFDDTFIIAGPGNSTLQLKNAFSSTTTGSGGAVTCDGATAANVSATLNGAALRQPYVKLSLSKVA